MQPGNTASAQSAPNFANFPRIASRWGPLQQLMRGMSLDEHHHRVRWRWALAVAAAVLIVLAARELRDMERRVKYLERQAERLLWSESRYHKTDLPTEKNDGRDQE